MQWCYSHTFISSHWLPVAESTTSTLCTNSYPYKVLLPHFQTCDGEWWGGSCVGVCGRSGSGPPILNGVLWVGQSTQVSWKRPGDPDCSSCGQWLQWDHPWGTHCSKRWGTFYMRHNYHTLRMHQHEVYLNYYILFRKTQWYFSHTFTGSHGLPAAESTTSTLCINGYPYKVLLPHFQACDGEWWGERCAGVCGRSGSGPPILNGVLWVGQSTQVSWRRPGDPDCCLCSQRFQWYYLWGTHCSKERGMRTLYKAVKITTHWGCNSIKLIYTTILFRMTQWHSSHTFTGSHWLPAAEITTSTLCMNGYPHKVLLPHFQACDGEWWRGRCAGLCGRSRSVLLILNGVLWVGQSTQVSWRRPGDPDCSFQYQRLQWDHQWGTHCSKRELAYISSFSLYIL